VHIKGHISTTIRWACAIRAWDGRRRSCTSALGFRRANKEANATFNGDAAKVNLIVQSDFEHKCFQINLELIQLILSSIGTLLIDEHALKNAQAIASWLGLIGLPPTVFGLFKYLARRKGHEIESVSPVLQVGDHEATIKIASVWQCRYREPGTIYGLGGGPNRPRLRS
jgi:hypothetical protein